MSEWKRIFEEKRVIPPHNQTSRLATGPTQAFQLVLKQVDGIHTKQSEDGKASKHELRVSLFDSSRQHFFGRTWKSALHEARRGSQEQRSKVRFNEVVYFHTALCFSSVVAVVELVSISPGPGTSQNAVGTGFGLLQLFSAYPDSGTTHGEGRLSLLYGTPRALLHPALRDPLQMNAVFTVMEGTQLLYSLQPHPALTAIMHLLPPNILVSGHDLIPGVLPSTDNSDVLRRPQLLPSFPCVLERVCVLLIPSLEAFEEELQQRLNADRHSTKLGCQVRAVVVQERRLYVGVHNGWGWVDGPRVLVLEPGAPLISSPSLSSTPTPSHSPDPSLMLRGSVELRMVSHPAFCVVFQLEYVFSVPLAAEGEMSSMTIQRTVFMQCVRWAVWSPFSDPCGPSDSVCVRLQGGAIPNPCGVMIYTAHSQQAEAGESSFRFRFAADANGTTSSKTLKTVPRQTGPPKKLHSTSQDESELQASPLTSTRGPGLSLSQLAATSRYPTMSHTMASPWQQQLPALPAPSPMASAHQLSHVEHPAVTSIAHLEVSVMKRGEMKDEEDCDLRELTFTPVHAPVIALGTHVVGSSRTSSRRSLAHLFSSRFPEIRDGLNQVAEVLDPSEAVHFDPQREEADPLQASTLILQFLAFTRIPQAGVGVGWPSWVHFTFQLYRFPPVTTQRLRLLEPEGGGGSDDPCVLAPAVGDGAPGLGAPGLQLQYRVDPATLKPGERPWFLRYLALHSLHIDVWDSDSLLLIGSAAVELKHLLRQGRSAVQVHHELEIITTEYLQDSAVAGEHDPVINVYTSVKGRLHVRLGNVGSMAEATPSSMTSLPPSRSRIVHQRLTAGGFQGGSLSVHAVVDLNVRNTRRAQRLPEIDGELASLLKSRIREVGGALSQGRGETQDTHQRKIDRMAAVRQHENTTPTGQDKMSSMSQRRREDRLRHADDLHVIEVYRERCKAEGITTMLSQAITTTHTLYATLATAEFFEFLLKNPFNVPQTVTIECDDPELSVVEKAEEWRYLKDLTKTSTPLEAEMFHLKGSGLTPQVYLRPKESVHVPFKYQTFVSAHARPSTDVSGLKKVESAQVAYHQQSNTILAKSIKAIFRAEDGQPLAICQVKVEPTPHVVDQTFRFYQPELNFLKKAIRLPPAAASETDGHASLHVRCSDPSVICHASCTAPGEPRDIYLRVPGAPSPHIKKFFICVFTDPWLASPAQTWQVYVHSLQKLDLSCVCGTRSLHSLVLRGTQTIRKVQCYTSHPLELQVDPAGVFALPAQAVQDVRLGVRLRRSGASFRYVTAVDVDTRQLVAAWLLSVTCRPPLVSRAFEIRVPVGGARGSSKKLRFTNPYSSSREFLLASDQPDLLHFKEERFQIKGGENYSIGLRFAPSQSAGTQEILVFINDVEDKNEETYCVRVVYT